MADRFITTQRLFVADKYVCSSVGCAQCATTSWKCHQSKSFYAAHINCIFIAFVYVLICVVRTCAACRRRKRAVRTLRSKLGVCKFRQERPSAKMLA